MASRLQIGKLAAESAAIFFSVILAFAVEEWRSDREEQERAEATMTLVRAELEQNLEELKRVRSGRQGQLDTYIDKLGQLKDTGSFPQTLPRLITPDITDIAYQLGTDSGAVSRFPTDAVLKTALAYEALSTVSGNEDFIDSRNAQVRYRDGEQYLSGFIYYINRAQVAEPEAITAIEEAISELERIGITAPE
ncbi:hypothetical protein HK107_09855 [Parvularcula sp. ZS-1/3]|uniref:Uncharacterized protein n=1 Tax=Parvularcula mediterranea TaxID=2732508 RepID=A0A7Y3RMA6_9PROT|nr:hypothetical protein [Parvularcula mediterranea]NNU16624.1 hypothetical protein [Parvularcula mediterranea]